MNVVDLDGNTQSWHLTGYIAKGKMQHKSSFHLEARKILTKAFPTMQILEEVPVPLRKSETLYLDFYIPLLKMSVEVHGEQHYKFIPFYHNSRMSFLKSQKRDHDKQEWCEKNGIKYIVFGYMESPEVWEQRIMNNE